MDRRHPCVVVADLPLCLRAIKRLLQNHFRVVEASEYEAAVHAIREEAPNLVIVGYHFDELRPYRLIQHIRKDLANPPPILMVQALPVERGKTEDSDVREAYNTLGVRQFVALQDLFERHGDNEAPREFAKIIWSLLVPTSG